MFWTDVLVTPGGQKPEAEAAADPAPAEETAVDPVPAEE